MRWVIVGTLVLSFALGALVLHSPLTAQEQSATGYVFHDRDRDGKRDPDEPGIANIRVSNGEDIVKTDRNGRWQLKYDGDTKFFVIKPRGWMTPVNKDQLPRFYYVHKPNGSPKVQYGGVEPTGPLPESIDFALFPQREPNKFKALFFGDTQPRDKREVDYITHDVVEHLVGKTDAAFGVTLGDVVFDDLSVFEYLNSSIALIGIPWYNVLGNHDINYDVPDDEHSDETWERIYGPNYYSFDYGPTHFIALDDVQYTGQQGTQRGSYKGGIGKTQMEWLKKDLSLIPSEQLVVLLMHIPLVDVEDRHELFRLIEKRPYALSVSAHTHYQEHKFIKKEDGWQGAQPHHHVINVTVCGSWWQGSPDELGIPNATMRDGAPNGYSIFSFDGHNYSIEYRAARRPSDYQMNIYVSESVKSNARELVGVNFFSGNEKSVLEMCVDDGAWLPLTRTPKQDPEFAKAYERDRGLTAPYRPLPAPIASPHYWEAPLPAALPTGSHRLTVRARDMFGQVYTAHRLLRVE
jgi:hypothetical protein